MEINEITNATPQSTKYSSSKEDPELRKAVQEVEGLFLGILLKEGIKPGSIDEEEKMGNLESLFQYSLEQVGTEMAQEGGVGLGNILYEQLLEGR
jgi:Rod binding domain-containing protein